MHFNSFNCGSHTVSKTLCGSQTMNYAVSEARVKPRQICVSELICATSKQWCVEMEIKADKRDCPQSKPWNCSKMLAVMRVHRNQTGVEGLLVFT